MKDNFFFCLKNVKKSFSLNTIEYLNIKNNIFLVSLLRIKQVMLAWLI